MAILYDTPVLPEEFVAVEQLGNTGASDTVEFTGLNPNYGYEIFFNSQDSGPSLRIPKWTNVSKYISGSGNTATMTLTYTISGGISGDSFALKRTIYNG